MIAATHRGASRAILASLLVASACGPSLPDDPDAGEPPDGGTDASTAEDAGWTPDSGPPPSPCAAGCLIADVCYPDGVADPADPCRVCDVARSTTAFSPNEGARCDDGEFCTVSDVCDADGACAGTARTCDDGIACNGMASCDEDMDACLPGTPTCSGGQVCDAITGECVLECSGCLIDGSCYGDGQVDPLDPCRVCDVSSSRSSWSANDGAACDDGLFCTVTDVCAGGACTGGGARECSDGVACDGVETCDEDADACTAGASTCGAGAICDVASDSCVAVCTGCVIDGACYGAGQRNPASQCEVCAPSASSSAWTPNDGASCDDGLFCTQGDTCAGTSCGGAPRACSDGIACNGVESCDESADACAAGTSTCAAGTLCDLATDSCVATCSGCVIGGTCYGAGQLNPANPCEVCAVATSPTAWTANDGARCDDGLFCTDGDVCSAGSCAGSPRVCADGVACNGTETCDEVAGACAPGTPTCAASQVCDVTGDACVTRCTGCTIGGVCYAAGTRNPANACEICDLARSSSAWSADDGASCDDGAFCTRGDVCSGGVCAGSAADFCGDGVACNGVETCSESTDRCLAGATTCAAGQICDPTADACVTACSGCVIGGVCYADGTRNPANPCQRCVAVTADDAWTVDVGAACDDGLFCTVGDTCSAVATCGGSARSCSDGVACNGAETCNESADRCDAGPTTCGAGELCDAVADVCRTTCGGCVIGGVCYAPGTANPANRCQTCAPATSATAWTPATGATCDDGLFCTVSDACTAAATCAGTARSCSDGVACNGVEACNESADRCDAGTPTCGAGELCDPVADACRTTCSGCVIGGVCYASGTTNPANRCQICAPATSATAWSADTGAPCDDGLYCTVGETCSALAVCGGGAARACSDGVACNGAETCNESADRCDAGTPTCTGGEVCDAGADACVLVCVGGTTRCGAVCADTDHDPAHCGGCGVACDPWEHCAGGTCVVGCAVGFADCDGTTANGCEAQLSSDLANCGACGNACGGAHATPQCTAGACTLSCDSGWADCDGLIGNGCEVSLGSDLAHCGACGATCSAPPGGTPLCASGVCTFTAPAAAVELWSASVSATMLSIWADGTLHVTGSSSAHVNPATGALTPVPTPGGRAAIWIDSGTSRNVNGGIVDRRGHRPDGTLDWEWIGLGCCNWNQAMAIDVAAGVAYTSQNTELFRIDLSSGAGSSWIGGGAWGGRDSMRGAGLYVAGFHGSVTRYDVVARTALFTVPIDPGGDPASPRMYPGAVLEDDSFVVTTTTGRIARVLSDGTVAWNLPGYGFETGPIDLAGVYVLAGSTTPLGIAAFDRDGTHVATVPTGAAVRDLLTADGSRIYALLASGEVVVVDGTRGQIVGTYTGLPTAGEMLLREGVLYVLGDGRLHALPVASTGYDPASAWPVKHHDNQRTSNGLAPMSY